MAGDDLDSLSFFSGSQKKTAPEGEPSASPSFFDKPEGEPPNRLPLSNAPGDTYGTGTVKNTATTTAKGLAHVPGMAGDLVEMGLGVGASAVSKIPENPAPDRFNQAAVPGVHDIVRRGLEAVRSLNPGTREHIEQSWRESLAANAQKRRREAEARLEDPNLSDREKNAIRRHIARIDQNPEGRPPTGEEIYQKTVAPVLGEYTPTTAAGRFGRAAGEAAIPSMLMPGMGTAKAGMSGATAGVAGHGANEYLGITDPLALFGISAAGAGVPSIPGAVMPKRLNTPAAKELEAGKRILKYTDNPEAALAEGQARAHLPDEPLAEATQDPAHAAAQDTILSSGQPDLTRTLQQRRAQQNLDILAKLRGLGPIEHEPSAVSQGFQKHLADLEGVAETAQPAVAPPADIGGANLRDTVHGPAGAGTRLDANLTKLENSIDPERKFSLWTGDLAGKAQEHLNQKTTRPEADRSAFADEYLTRAANFGNIKNFMDLVDFDRSLTAAIKKTRGSDPIGVRALGELKGWVKEAENNALENQHKWQQEAVARGELAPEQTFAHNIQRTIDEQAAAQRQQAVAGGDRAGETAANTPGRQGGIPGDGGAEVPPPGGSPDAARPQGVPGEPPVPLTGDAAERLRLYNAGYGIYKDRYTKGPVGQAGETEFGGQPSQMNAAVAEKAFVPGPKGFETANMWLTAGGDEAAAALKDIATNRLQAELAKGKGKPLDQQTLGTWKAKHEAALRAIDEADRAAGRPEFSKQFDNAATAQQAVHDFENSSAKKFLGLNSDDDVVYQVGKIMNGENAATNIGRLVDQAKAIPDNGGEAILGGLRRAGAQALENQFRQEGAKIATHMTGERDFEPMVGGARLQKFINDRSDTLYNLFEHDAVDQMKKVAEQNDRSTAVRTAMSPQHGSQTAIRSARTKNMKELGQQMDAAMALDIKSGAQSTFSALAMWEGMKGVLEALRGGGMEGMLTAGALLGANKAWSKALERAGIRHAAEQADVAHLMGQGFASREVGLGLMEKAMNENGMPNQRAFDKLAQALRGAEAAEQQREGRAEGGRVGGKPEDIARKMIETVEKARRMDVERTKPLLKVDDHAVATALAAAGRHI